MKNRCFAFGISVLFLIFCSSVTFAGEQDWLTDFDNARAQSKKEGKDLLVDFTGSDWCGWCIKLDKEVFSQEAFLKDVKNKFVLVIVDSPRKGPTPEATALINKYGISGYPTILLMFDNGLPYARTGYQKGGPENYLKHLTELQNQREVIQELLKKADTTTGAEQKKTYLSVFEKCQELELPLTWIAYAEKLVTVDPENKKGYLVKVGSKLSQTYIMANQADKGKVLLESIVKLKPKEAEPYLYLADLYAQKYSWADAVPICDKALDFIDMEKSMQEWISTRVKKATCLFNLYKFDLAQKEYETILSSDIAARLNPQGKEKLLGQKNACTEYKEFWHKEQEIRQKETKANNNPIAEVKTNKGIIILELFEDNAPNTVANFISLAEKEFYNGILFHRVIPNFMIQGGDPFSKDNDPANDGTGGPEYTFEDELSSQYRKHFVGSLSMANSGPNTNGSQFFITHVPTSWLNGKHTVFGMVKKGQEVVNSIQKGDTITSVKITRKRSHKYEPKVKPK